MNLHQGLGPNDLTRRYLRRHDRDDSADWDPFDVYEMGVDDYWDPWYEASPPDFQLHRMWQDVLGSSHLPRIEFPEVLLGTERAAPPAEAPASTGAIEIGPDRLPDALYEHLQRVTSHATRQACLANVEVAAALEQVRSSIRRQPELWPWFEQRWGPGVMLLVLAPFWIRPLATWSPPSLPDVDAITRSLLDHLFLRYPVPESLYQPWHGRELPRLKWAAWLVLIGQGASLRRAAPRFGWSVSSKHLPQLYLAPPELDPIEALMWAEITLRGGTRLELDRLRAHAAYRFDPTASPDQPDGLAFEDQNPERAHRLHPNPHHGFWRATVDWLVRHRDELAEDQVLPILGWAMHRHTEDLARDVAEPDRFSWRGRTPAAVRARAEEYHQLIMHAHRRDLTLAWKPRGWDWEHREDGGRSWSVQELFSTAQLAAESAAMRHCVVSYAYRCAQGSSVIFSVTLDGVRRFTVELEPRSRRIVQARGACNRPCTEDELAIAELWLADLARRETQAMQPAHADAGARS